MFFEKRLIRISLYKILQFLSIIKKISICLILLKQLMAYTSYTIKDLTSFCK